MRIALRRLLGGTSPSLSVVVPAYNVEAYIDPCLESILAQPFDDIEVIVIEDGSTDRTAAIVREIARSDRRIRMVRQSNRGLGEARNAGAALARGEYLTFCDGDDLLPPDAWTRMMTTLRITGSDLVIGAIRRFDGQSTRMTPWMKANHRRDVLKTDVTRCPSILADVFAVNKIFRRSFWSEHDLSFPSGVRYEDQPTLTAAMLRASSIDVLRDTVYLWRSRPDGSSITQNRHAIEDLRDRLLTKRTSTELVEAHGDDEVRRFWYAAVLAVDMWEYFRSAPGCSEEYWTMLVDGVRELWHEGTLPFSQTELPVQQRLMGWLVAQDRRADLEKLISYLDERDSRVRVDVVGDRVEAQLPFRDDPATPREAVDLAAHELQFRARLQHAEIDAKHLNVAGFALIDNVPLEERCTDLRVTLQSGDHPVQARVSTATDLTATGAVHRIGQTYDDCGFNAEFDLADIVSRGPGVWTFDLCRQVGHFSGRGTFTGWVQPVPGHRWHDVGEHQARLTVRNGAVRLEVR